MNTTASRCTNRKSSCESGFTRKSIEAQSTGYVLKGSRRRIAAPLCHAKTTSKLSSAQAAFRRAACPMNTTAPHCTARKTSCERGRLNAADSAGKGLHYITSRYARQIAARWYYSRDALGSVRHQSPLCAFAGASRFSKRRLLYCV